MALQSSGQISLNDMHIEVGGSSGSQVSLNDTDIRDLIGKSSGAQSSFSEFYGAAAETDVPSSATINGQANAKEITASNLISSGGTLVIPSNFWVWSDNTSVAALTVDIPCTVKNYGKIIGRGSNGTALGNAGNGGNAIRITSSGVSIINYSGAWIAGGGGGGAGGGPTGYPDTEGGGGGAGGGIGGQGDPQYGNPGAGGLLNAAGGNSYRNSPNESRPSSHGGGGGAGGGGGGNYGGGGGGGRILPGTGGARGINGYSGGEGGSANNNGQNTPDYGAGGGGGWAATGGYGRSGYFNSSIPTAYGGSGGAAISKTTSYSLSNSGTIYGST